MKILFHSKDDNAVFDRLRTLLPEHELLLWPQHGDPQEIDFAVLWGPPDNFFDGMTQLKAILSIGAGVDHLLQHPKLPSGVPVIRLQDAGMAEKIAEYVLYGVLRAQRLFHHYEQQQRVATWQPLADIHAQDFRVGIMGVGAIGMEVGKRLQLNGYPVSGWRRKAVADNHGIDCHFGDQGLKPFFANLNVLVCLLPLTPETTGILNSKTLAQLPAGAHLINAARGGHVIEQDLITALDSQHIASALLDVCSVEPASADHPFWQHPQITLTPHVAGPTQDQLSAAQIAQSIQQFGSDAQPAGLVDRDAGY